MSINRTLKLLLALGSLFVSGFLAISAYRLKKWSEAQGELELGILILWAEIAILIALSFGFLMLATFYVVRLYQSRKSKSNAVQKWDFNEKKFEEEELRDEQLD
jgi:TRAP-type C4-dicarboxylate transport system permease small subunit